MSNKKCGLIPNQNGIIYVCSVCCYIYVFIKKAKTVEMTCCLFYKIKKRNSCSFVTLRMYYFCQILNTLRRISGEHVCLVSVMELNFTKVSQVSVEEFENRIFVCYLEHKKIPVCKSNKKKWFRNLLVLKIHRIHVYANLNTYSETCLRKFKHILWDMLKKI
jgi:hypothetical protein